MNNDKLLFLSEDWLKRYMELLNSNQQYEEVAKGWEGDFVFQIDSDGKTVTEPIRAYVDFWHSKCRAVHPAHPGKPLSTFTQDLSKTGGNSSIGTLAPSRH